MKTTDQLNRRLWALLGLKVIDGAALARDGKTWLKTFIRSGDGKFADPPPDLAHDLNETVKHLPKDVQFHLRWSVYTEKWSCLLTRLGSGEYLAEAYAEQEAEAAALALEQLLGNLRLPRHTVELTVLNT